MAVLSDVTAERAVLSGICRYGEASYLDVADILNDQSFTIDYNQIVYACISHIFKQEGNEKIDVASIYCAGEELGLSNIMSRKEVLEHINALFVYPVLEDNVRKFAAKIRKLQIARLLREQLKDAANQLIDIEGSESIAHILGIAENSIFDFSSLLNDIDHEPKELSDGLEDYINYLAENPIDQIGISTGFPRYDKAIGGGFRNGTINIIGARTKAQPLDCKILTPDGWKLMGDIEIGDEICSPIDKSGVTKVVNIFPQGEQDCYKITFSDGTSTRASKDHEWIASDTFIKKGQKTFKQLSIDEMNKIKGESEGVKMIMVKK